MRLKRETTNKINWVLDNLLPPILRDSRLVMSLPFHLAFGRSRKAIMEFHERSPCLNDRELAEYYGLYPIERETDLTRKVEERILDCVEGPLVMDISCGKGHLVRSLATAGHAAVGVDIVLQPGLRSEGRITYVAASLQHLPFADDSFDTVVSTHTLEHVPDIRGAMAELRRVAKRRVILVVPRQREYRFTFDNHVHFFPYAHSLLRVMGDHGAHLELVDNDFLYVEGRSTLTTSGAGGTS